MLVATAVLRSEDRVGAVTQPPACGGCVAAEHGIGKIKQSFLPVQYPPEVMTASRAVKRWVDPDWRLNPGVLIDP